MRHSGIFWRLVLVLGGLCAAALAVLCALSWAGADAWIITLTAAVGLVFVLAGTAFVAQRIAGPLVELSTSLRSLGEGKYGKRVFSASRDEIGLLAAAFNETSQACATREWQLDEERRQLRAILKSMVEGVLVIDAEQRIQFVNEAAGRFLHLDVSGVLGKKIWEAARQRQLAEAVERIVTSEEPHCFELEWGAGEHQILAVHGVQLPGPPMYGAVLVFHDITHLRKLERVRQDFVANVSHELKTPLAAIQATAETLLEGAIRDPQHNVRFLERIRENADRLYRLVQDLLTLGRIEAANETMNLEALSLQTCAMECASRHSERVSAKGLTIELEAPGETIQALADEEALAEILDNLVDNAIKYTPPGGKITLRWFGRSGEAVLQVEDTGVGIPHKDLSRIFERFYRVDKARSRELGGTGLGLSIVKHLVQQLGGSIRAESQIGEGTTFTVCLSRQESAASRPICTQSS